MRCMMCHEKAEWDRTFFQGTAPTHVRLCQGCGTKVDLQTRLEKIYAAEDHDAKNAAVGELIAAVSTEG